MIIKPPKKIWLQVESGYHDELGECSTWCEDKIDNTDIKYIRHARYAALLDAAVSLHHWLFEITDTMLNRPDVGEREMADMLDDAQLAISKYNRFLDGKTEEE